MKKDRKKRIKKKRSKVTRKFSWKALIGFLVFQIIFTPTMGMLILLHGPFNEAKNMFVGTAMGSMHYQWLAKAFLSDKQINTILGISDSNDDSETQDSSLLKLPKAKDDTIECYQLEDNPKFNGYALIISDPTRVKVGVSSKLNKEGETVSKIAENYDAVAAINGGSFTDEEGTEKWTSNGGIPCGLLMSDGKVIHDDLGGEATDMAAITDKGELLVGKYTTDELKDKNVKEALSFGPVLVRNGKAVNLTTDVGARPKTLIGQRADGAIVFVVLDSKTPGGAIAATLKECQEVMLKLNCLTATNLDGGKSTTMYLNGEVINNPSSVLGERPIASGFIVK